MTLNGVIALFCFVSANSGIFRAHCVKVHVRYLIYWWVLVEACRYTIERSVHASNAPTRPRKLPLRVRVLTNGRAVQNGWTDRDAAQTADSYGLKEQCISWMSILAPSGEYDWTFSCTIQKATARKVVYDHLLWSPYGIGQTIIFSYCRLFYLFSSFSLA